MMRVRFMPLICRETAFMSLCWGTSRGTSACRAGMFSEKIAPAENANRKRYSYSIKSVRMRIVVTRLTRAAADCVTMSNVRLFTRSATSPPTGARKIIGMAAPTVTHASAEALPPERSYASWARSTNCICIAMKKAELPAKYQANSRSLSEERVRCRALS